MKFGKDKLKQSAMLFFVLSPFIIIYNYLFYASMNYDKDRFNYLNIMRYPFEGREEPLLHFISYIFSFFIDSPDIKLLVIQNLFIFLLLISLVNFYYKLNKSITFIGVVFVVILLVFSNYFITQIRLGYSISLLLFILSIIDFNEGKKLNKILILLPVLMHFGSIFFVIFYFIFNFLKINNFYKFLYFLFAGLFVLTVFNFYIGNVFNFIGIDPYYLGYLDDSSELNDGRLIPYTLIFYLLLVVFLIFYIIKRRIYNIHYYFSLSGLILVYWGGVLGFYLSFKFLAPISVYALLLCATELKFKNNFLNFIVFFVLLFCLILIFCLYFSHQVGVKLELLI